MHTPGASPVALYLPLLNSTQPGVRRQACALLLSTYGEHGLTMLRRCLAAPDQQMQQQARRALHHIAELTPLPVQGQPFQGIYVECLGRMRLYADSEEVQLSVWARRPSIVIGWQKLQAVLGYLLHCGRRATTRAALETAVWGGERTTTVTRTIQVLRELLTELRGEGFAAGALVIADNHCLLRPEAFQSDVQAFEQAYAVAVHTEESLSLEAAAPIYATAARLYGGPYMIDMPQGAPWARARRDHLRGNFLLAAERLAAHSFAQGRYEECAELCAQVFDADEGADEVVGWLLRAYRQLGQQGLLEHTYRRYLQANTLDPHSHDGREDAAVQVYAQLQAGGGHGIARELRGPKREAWSAEERSDMTSG